LSNNLITSKEKPEETNMHSGKRRSQALLFGLAFTLLVGCSSHSTQMDTSQPLQHTSGSLANRSFDKAVANNSSATSNQLPSTQKMSKKMIYTARINLTVPNYKDTKTKLEALVERHGGYMVNSSEKSSHTIRGDFTYRIPQAQFDPFIKEIPKLTKSSSPSIQINGNDVSEEMVDLESRLKAKQVMESRLLDFMNKATKTSDLLSISTQLNQTQEEIEQIKGRLNYLNNKVDFSTVHLTIEQAVVSPTASNQSLGKQMAEAFSLSIAQLKAFGENLLIFLAGALPVLFVLGVITVPVIWLVRRVKKKNNQPTPPPASDSSS
jgi:hypothetical protein